MALLYIIISILLGASIVLFLKPYWQSRIILLNSNNVVSPTFLLFPASYLVGTLILSWITYFLALAFKDSGSSLLYANIFSFLLALLIILFIAFLQKKRIEKFLYNIKRRISINIKKSEWFVIIASTIFWAFFINRSLFIDGDILKVGVSAFSDFGANLPVIRSFSLGSNFPTQYPHFPDGTIRYHFMFYFMAGNLEYLGLPLPQALNIPSILSLICLNMLLYSLATFLTKKILAGIITCVLFTFRSSFSFFTFASEFSSPNDFLYAIAKNRNADGTFREHIGNTLNEGWGLWTQKVYINQRHFAFALGLFILSLFLMLPIFVDIIEYIKKQINNVKKGYKSEFSSTNRSIIIEYIITIMFSKKAWVCKSIMPCVLAGLILGLLAFWNGAVVIGAISVLFIMAALSKHKLEYLITAVITFILSTLQSRLFAGTGTGVVSLQYTPGFLAKSDSLHHILSYFIELLGILPFILVGVYIAYTVRKRKWIGILLSSISIIILIMFMPAINLFWKVIILGAYFCFLAVIFMKDNNIHVSDMSVFLIPVFLSPIILASTLQLTPDITVNHKYIMQSVMLLNIPVADLLSELFKPKKISNFIALYLAFLLSCTGIVDMITLYNLDKNNVSYNQRDAVHVWVKNETNPDDIFLTHYMTHYGAPMSIMLAGRSVYNGYPYFTITAGYDISTREKVMKKIYNSTVPDELRQLAVSEGIDYIVVEEQNREATEYDLDESIFKELFTIAFQSNDITIYEVK